MDKKPKNCSYLGGYFTSYLLSQLFVTHLGVALLYTLWVVYESWEIEINKYTFIFVCVFQITWTAHAMQDELRRQCPGIKYGEACIVSYLPLSHIAAQLLDMYCAAAIGGTAYFAQPDALKVIINGK